MAKLIIEKNVKDGIYIVRVSVKYLTDDELLKIEKFGDVEYIIPSVININDSRYFNAQNPAQSSANFSVPIQGKIKLVTQTPIEFRFNSKTNVEAKENALDMVRVLTIDITNLWAQFTGQVDDFTGVSLIDL